MRCANAADGFFGFMTGQTRGGEKCQAAARDRRWHRYDRHLMSPANIQGSSAPARPGLPLALLTVAVVLAGAPAPRAQAPDPAAASQTRGLRVLPRERSELPGLLPPAPEPEFELPPPPAGATGARGGPQVLRLEAVRLRGSTVLSHAEVAGAAAPFVGRTVSAADLQALRQRLTRLYVERGYLNSGVILPDQDVAQGTVVFQAVEGTLTELDVSGGGRLRPRYVRARLAAATAAPVNVLRVREALALLQRDPLIDRIHASFTPGERPGEARLSVDAVPAPAFGVTVSVDNARSPSIGATGRALELAHRNLSGRGDAATLAVHRTDGLDERSASYSLPLSARGATLTLGYRYSEAAVVEAPFDEVDIASESEDLRLTLDVPVRLTLATRLAFGLALESRHSQTTLLGRPFSFSAGVNDGRAEVSVVRLHADWLSRRADSVLAARATLSAGVDVLDATRNARRPDTRFTSMLTQLQWVQRLGERSQLVLRGDLQLAADPLLPQEQYALGGAATVRGYRENLLVRDSGWLASAEWRTDLWRPAAGRGGLQLALFADAGRGWNRRRATARPDSISSAGVGLRWSAPAGLHAELYLAEPLRNVSAGSDLQDDGVHFRLGWTSFRR